MKIVLILNLREFSYNFSGNILKKSKKTTLTKVRTFLMLLTIRIFDCTIAIRSNFNELN